MRRHIMTGYRVDMRLTATGGYAPYAGSKKQPLSADFAASLREYLKRQGSPGRLVRIPDETVEETW